MPIWTASPAAIRPDRQHARVDPEQRLVARRRGGAAARATSPACRGSRVGIAQRTHGCSSRSTTPPAKRSVAPSQPCSAHAGASSSRCRLVRNRRRSSSAPSSSSSAARVASTRHRAGCARGPGSPARSRRSRTGRPRSVGQRAAQPRVVPAVGVLAAGRGHVRVGRALGAQPGVGRERVRGAPREQPRRLARGQRLPLALVLVQHGVGAVAAGAAVVDARRSGRARRPSTSRASATPRARGRPASRQDRPDRDSASLCRRWTSPT